MLTTKQFHWDKARKELVGEISDVYDAEHKVPRIFEIQGERETITFRFVKHEYNPEGGLDAEVIALHYVGCTSKGRSVALVLIND